MQDKNRQDRRDRQDRKHWQNRQDRQDRKHWQNQLGHHRNVAEVQDKVAVVHQR